MHGAERVAALSGLVALRRLQVRAREMQAAQATREATDESRRADAACERLASHEAQWLHATDAARFDLDAIGHLSAAILHGVAESTERVAARDAARARENDARIAWRQAEERAKDASTRRDAAARAERRRKDEAALHHTAERHAAFQEKR
jgi:hypothetical protein